MILKFCKIIFIIGFKKKVYYIKFCVIFYPEDYLNYIKLLFYIFILPPFDQHFQPMITPTDVVKLLSLGTIM